MTTRSTGTPRRRQWSADRARARPVQENVNFYEQVNELHKLAYLLHDGYSTHLDEYEQMQREFSGGTDARDAFARLLPIGVLATSLFGDLAATLREHRPATLAEHCGYFRRLRRGSVGCATTALSAASFANGP